MNNKIWLSSPHMGENELKYVQQAFETNWIAPLGPHVNEFEKQLASYTGSNHAAALSSGTAALHLALILLGVKSGDEVLCSTFTFSASANPIVYQEATPVFIDSEPDTWNMDPEILESAIKDRIKKGKRPKAVVLVHLYGMPAKMDEIMEVCDRYEIPVIEDAAEALGASYGGKHLGSLGSFGVLSFNGNKIITTSGGGALLGNDAVTIEKARFLATQARDSAPHYQHSHIGYNYRMSNVLAGIGRGQMEVLDQRVKQRRANFQFYYDALKEVSGVSFQPELNKSFSNRWLTCLHINPAKAKGIDREKIRLKLESDQIESRPLWKPMHLQPVFKDYPYYGGNLSEELFEHGLCLPSGSNLTQEDLNRVLNHLLELF
jgi:dTDP-4-amino-4,6-dideoxygalactose transaminase